MTRLSHPFSVASLFGAVWYVYVNFIEYEIDRKNTLTSDLKYKGKLTKVKVKSKVRY